MKTKALFGVSCTLGLFLLVFLLGSSFLIAAESSDYKIAPGDKIVVDVFNEKELQKELTVSATGEITFPLLGTVRAAGLTTVQLQDRLRQDLGRDYLVDPQVTVQVREYKKRLVSVYGQVVRAGLIDLPAEEPMTIIQAIAQAGGFLRSAKTGDIQVSRKGRTYRFSDSELRKNLDPEKTFYLQPGDSIYVPESVL